MNSALFINTIRFIALVLLQVLVCNQLNFMGSLNPYVYVLFVLLYPIGSNRMGFIFLAFSLGLILDLFLVVNFPIINIYDFMISKSSIKELPHLILLFKDVSFLPFWAVLNHNDNLAQIISISVYVFANYSLNKFITFKQKI